ncbi:MAG: alpha/beta hydrolase [Chloroflexota bacterium]|nr:alpha/beta hydrolase [Chloroflexota bacterium]
MLADLVSVTTPEGIPLAGAYFAPANPDPSLAVDAVLFFHGDTGNFYGGLYLDLGQRMAERGIAFLAANRRGHDHVSNGVRGGPLAGYAFESVDDSRADFTAWLGLLRERGHRRIAIGGHSGGAVRAAYAQAKERFEDVVAVIPVSPGEYNHEGVVALHGEAFAGPFRESERNVAEGRPDVLIRPGVPWGSTWSAGAFVDCFNQDNRYSVSRHAADTGRPTLFVFGAEECAVGGPQELPVCGAACRRLEDLAYPHVTVRVIDGAAHGYHGREEALFETMFGWLREL